MSMEDVLEKLREEKVYWTIVSVNGDEEGPGVQKTLVQAEIILCGVSRVFGHLGAGSLNIPYELLDLHQKMAAVLGEIEYNIDELKECRKNLLKTVYVLTTFRVNLETAFMLAAKWIMMVDGIRIISESFSEEEE